MPSGKHIKWTEKLLNHVYQLHVNGFKDPEIAIKLGIHPQTFSRNKIHVLKYYAKRERALRNAHNREHPGRPRGSSKLEAYKREIIHLAECGLNQSDIARRIDIPISTLRTWLSFDEEFAHEVETAHDKLTDNVYKGLYKRAVGFTTREVAVTEINNVGGISIGLPQRTVNRKVVRVLPNVKAQELWLINNKKFMSA